MYNIITKRKRRGGFLFAFPFMDAAVLAPFSTKLFNVESFTIIIQAFLIPATSYNVFSSDHRAIHHPSDGTNVRRR